MLIMIIINKYAVMRFIRKMALSSLLFCPGLFLRAQAQHTPMRRWCAADSRAAKPKTSATRQQNSRDMVGRGLHCSTNTAWSGDQFRRGKCVKYRLHQWLETIHSWEILIRINITRESIFLAGKQTAYNGNSPLRAAIEQEQVRHFYQKIITKL